MAFEIILFTINIDDIWNTVNIQKWVSSRLAGTVFYCDVIRHAEGTDKTIYLQKPVT